MELCLHSADRDLSWDGALSGSCLGSYFVSTYISDFIPCWVGRVTNQGSFPAHLWGLGCGGCNSSDAGYLSLLAYLSSYSNWLTWASFKCSCLRITEFLTWCSSSLREIVPGGRECKLLLPPDLNLELTVKLFIMFCWLDSTEGSPDRYRKHRSRLPARGVSIDLWPPYFFQGHVTLQTQRSFDVVETFHSRKVAQTLRSLMMDVCSFHRRQRCL